MILESHHAAALAAEKHMLSSHAKKSAKKQKELHNK
jgi:hypothetical protein